MRSVTISDTKLIIPETFFDRLKIRFIEIIGRGKIVCNFTTPYGESLIITNSDIPIAKHG